MPIKKLVGTAIPGRVCPYTPLMIVYGQNLNLNNSLSPIYIHVHPPSTPHSALLGKPHVHLLLIGRIMAG